MQIETHSNKCRLKATSQSDMDNWMVILQKVLLVAEFPYVNIKWKSSIKRPKQTISGHLYLVNFINKNYVAFKHIYIYIYIYICIYYDSRLSMSCCVIDGQTLMIKISTFTQTTQQYVSSITIYLHNYCYINSHHTQK